MLEEHKEIADAIGGATVLSILLAYDKIDDGMDDQIDDMLSKHPNATLDDLRLLFFKLANKYLGALASKIGLAFIDDNYNTLRDKHVLYIRLHNIMYVGIDGMKKVQEVLKADYNDDLFKLYDICEIINAPIDHAGNFLPTLFSKHLESAISKLETTIANTHTKLLTSQSAIIDMLGMDNKIIADYISDITVLNYTEEDLLTKYSGHFMHPLPTDIVAILLIATDKTITEVNARELLDKITTIQGSDKANLIKDTLELVKRINDEQLL